MGRAVWNKRCILADYSTIWLPSLHHPDTSGHYWTNSGQDRATVSRVKRNRVWQTMKCVTTATSTQCHTHRPLLLSDQTRGHTANEAAVDWLTS